jgi:hypothetical protein
MKQLPELNPFSYSEKYHQTSLKHQMVHLMSQSLNQDLLHSKPRLQGQSPTNIDKISCQMSPARWRGAGLY